MKPLFPGIGISCVIGVPLFVKGRARSVAAAIGYGEAPAARDEAAAMLSPQDLRIAEHETARELERTNEQIETGHVSLPTPAQAKAWAEEWAKIKIKGQEGNISRTAGSLPE